MVDRHLQGTRAACAASPLSAPLKNGQGPSPSRRIVENQMCPYPSQMCPHLSCGGPLEAPHLQRLGISLNCRTAGPLPDGRGRPGMLRYAVSICLTHQVSRLRKSRSEVVLVSSQSQWGQLGEPSRIRRVQTVGSGPGWHDRHVGTEPSRSSCTQLSIATRTDNRHNVAIDRVTSHL